MQGVREAGEVLQPTLAQYVDVPCEPLRAVEPGSDTADDAVLDGVPFQGARELLNSVLGRMFGHGGSALGARQPGPR